MKEVRNYKSLQSYRYYTSGWVLEVEWKKFSKAEVVLVLGKVKHSYAASKPPLRPWVLIRAVMFTVIQNTRSLIKNSAAVFIAEHRLVN